MSNAVLKTFVVKPTTGARFFEDEKTVVFKPFKTHDGDHLAGHFDLADLSSPAAGIEVRSDGSTCRLWATEEASAQIMLEGVPGSDYFVITNGDNITVVHYVDQDDSKNRTHRKLVITTNCGDLQDRLEAMGIMPYLKGGLEWVNTIHLAVVRRVNRKVADAFTAWRKAEFIARQQTTVVETAQMPLGSGEVVEDFVPDRSDAPLAIKPDRRNRRKSA